VSNAVEFVGSRPHLAGNRLAPLWAHKRLAVVAAGIATIVATLGAQARPALGRFVGVGFSAVVTSVYDGDTVHIKVDGTGEMVTVRLEGINAPELSESFGPEARNAARVMLFDKRVQLKGTDVDIYHRLVARITVAGTDSSLELVKAGLACHFKRYSSEAALAAAEVDARAHNRGFWAPGVRRPACGSPRPTPPGAGPFHGNRVSRVYHASPGQRSEKTLVRHDRQDRHGSKDACPRTTLTAR